MKKIDISNWREFRVGNLFYKLELGIKKTDFNKKLDVSEECTNEFNLPLVNAKHFNNGIMYYGRKEDFETASMTLDIVQNGAIATGDVYAQPQETGVLWDAYLIKPFVDIKSELTLQFLAAVLQKGIKQKYSYEDKCIWEKLREEKILLPISPDGEPDFAYMEQYMKGIQESTKTSVSALKTLIGGGTGQGKINSLQWHSFKIGDLFPDIVKPEVYHSHEVVEFEKGIPYIVRSKYNNGMKCRVKKLDSMKVSPSGVISFGAENASFFFQSEEWCSGRDIYYVNTTQYSEQVCKFLAVCFNKVTSKYNYSFGLFPDLLKEESIQLPVDEDGNPDWRFMEQFIEAMESKSKQLTQTLSKIA